jgi:type 1 glutamine amidotransferase
MKQSLILFGFLALGAAVLPAQQAQSSALTPEQKDKVDAAVPKKAAAKPKKVRRLLVTNLCMRDGKVCEHSHASSVVGNYAIEQWGKKLGAWETVVSDDISLLKPENIKQFDAICFNSTFGVLTEDPVIRQSLLDFVKNGGGLLGIHGAAATFCQYPKYDQFPAFGEMLGGYENGGHPWRANETITIKIDDPKNPINKAFKGKEFEVQDEVFQFQDFYSREKLHVLASIDTAKTDMNPKRHFVKARAEDKDFAMSWIRDYGKGRVFYTSFGHNPDIFWNQALVDHFVAAIQYVMGDLKADATPSAKLVAGKK